MAQARSYYGTGTSNTDVSFDPRMDPTAALQALIGRETSAPRVMAAAPAKQGRAYGVSRSSKSGPRESYTAGDAAMALAHNPGRHSFVQRMGGANQVSGYVNAAEGPSSVYGGWRVTDDPGATIDPRMQERGPAITGPSAEEIHGATNTAALGLGPSLAANQWRERQESMARGRK